MLQSKTIWLVAVLSIALSICLSPTVLANGNATDGTGGTTVSPPTGRGPTDANGAVPVATVSAIEARGHVVNNCEATVMMMNLISNRGGMKVVGDYRVAYIVIEPRGWYEPDDGTLTWRPPAPTETAHIEAVVMDALTGQPLPVNQVTVDVIDSQGKVVQSQQLQYYWHPMSNHYGANFAIPTAGTYSLRLRAPAPQIRRHSRELGNRFTAPVDTTFTGVQISPMAAIPELPVGAGPSGTTTGTTTPGATTTTPGTGTGTSPGTSSGTTDTTDTDDL